MNQVIFLLFGIKEKACLQMYGMKKLAIVKLKNECVRLQKTYIQECDTQ